MSREGTLAVGGSVSPWWQRALTWDEFVTACGQLWGADWVDAFCTNAGVTRRTVARWKQQGFVRRGPVIAMLDAFLKCKRAGLKYGDTIPLGAL